MKKNKISKKWLNRQKSDIYVRESKNQGYRARSVYKLIEINEKFKIFKNGISVIDLGAAPGSWSQYCSRVIKQGRIVSIDLKKMEKIDKIVQINGDFTETFIREKIKKLFNSKVEVVLSDMAANTTGIKNLDAIHTGELCIEAMKFSHEILTKNGIFVSKIFMGGPFNEIIKDAKSIFREVKVFKPKSSRSDSKESFIICKNLR